MSRRPEKVCASPRLRAAVPRRSRGFSTIWYEPIHSVLQGLESLERGFSMQRNPVNPEAYRRVVLAYHGLPVVTAFALVGVFLAGFFFTGSVPLSSVAAAVPAIFLLWRWVLAGKQIDRWGCPKCGEPFPKRMYWKYPPKVCLLCGERLSR